MVTPPDDLAAVAKALANVDYNGRIVVEMLTGEMANAPLPVELHQPRDKFLVKYARQAFHYADIALDLWDAAIVAQRALGRQEGASNREVELEAILEAIAAALDGQPISDFMESFPLVRTARDARSQVSSLAGEVARLREGLLQLQAMNTSDDGDEYPSFWAYCTVCDEEVGWPIDAVGGWPPDPICQWCLIKRTLSLHGSAGQTTTGEKS